MYLSTLTLNVNGLNAPIGKHRVAEWVRKQAPNICCLQESHLRAKYTYRLKIKEWKKICYANGSKQKKAEVAILIPDRIDFKTKAFKKNKKVHYIIIKESI